MQNSNQFKQTVEKGLLALIPAKVISCQVASDAVTPLVIGQAVKIKDVVGDTIIVEAVTAASDKIFGFVSFNMKNAEYAALDMVEIAVKGSIIYLEANAAIARGAEVGYVVTGARVATAVAGNNIVGTCLDKPTAQGQMCRIFLGEHAVTVPTPPGP